MVRGVDPPREALSVLNSRAGKSWDGINLASHLLSLSVARDSIAKERLTNEMKIVMHHIKDPVSQFKESINVRRAKIKELSCCRFEGSAKLVRQTSVFKAGIDADAWLDLADESNPRSR